MLLKMFLSFKVILTDITVKLINPDMSFFVISQVLFSSESFVASIAFMVSSFMDRTNVSC